MKSALILGGNRYFGKRLARILLDRGWSVSTLNRGSKPLPNDAGLEQLVADRNDGSRMRELVGSRRWDAVFDQSCYDARQARLAREAFGGNGIDRYIFTSTASVYSQGGRRPESAYDPRAHRFDREIDRDEDYGEAKRQAEAEFFRGGDFPVVAVRFPLVLGEDDYTERLKFHVDRVRSGKLIHFPNLEARISMIHSRDAAEFLASLADRPGPLRAEPVNCAAREPIRLIDFLGRIERACGRKALLAPSSEAGDPSPYGADQDWILEVDRLESSYGFKARPIDGWLPELISQLAR